MAAETGRTQVNMSVAPPVYPPERVSHWERAKGVYPQIIMSPHQLMQAAHELQGYGFDNGVTRYGVTYAVTADALAGLAPPERAELGGLYEGAIPLRGSGVEGADYLLHMGHNHPERRSTPAVIGEQLGKVDAIFSRPPSGEWHDLSAFQIGILTPEQRGDANIQQQLKVLYGGTFGYSDEEVAGMLTSNNIIAAAFHGDRIVSGGVIEFSPLSFALSGGDQIQVSRAEMTDGVTLNGTHEGISYTGKGIYTGVSKVLLGAAAQLAQEGSLNVLFSESNLEKPGVFAVAHHQGRRLPPADVYGLARRPLIQTCGIPGGKNGHGEAYNNLLQTYLVRDDLIRQAEGGRYDL